MKYRIINRVTNKVMAEFPGDQKAQAVDALRRIKRDGWPDPFAVIVIPPVGSTEPTVQEDEL
jgi:hypothetical protein